MTNNQYTPIDELLQIGTRANGKRTITRAVAHSLLDHQSSPVSDSTFSQTHIAQAFHAHPQPDLGVGAIPHTDLGCTEAAIGLESRSDVPEAAMAAPAQAPDGCHLPSHPPR